MVSISRDHEVVSNAQNAPDFVEYRLRLPAAKPIAFPTDTYPSAKLDHTRAYVSAPPNKWICKKTRGLCAFYFTSQEAIEWIRLCRKRARAAERAGEAYTSPSPAHVYIPLEPGHLLWMSIAVPDGCTTEDAVTEALWGKISPDAATLLKWYSEFLDDINLPLNLTTSEPTQHFVREYNALAESGLYVTEPIVPTGLLVDYIGPLKNDGSVHPQRRPKYPLPCVV